MANLDPILIFIIKSIIFIAFWCLYLALVMLAFNRGRLKELVTHKFRNLFSVLEPVQKPNPVEHSDKKEI